MRMHGRSLYFAAVLSFLLPRCIYMQGGLMHERNVCLSVRPPVCLSNAWIVTKRKKTCAHILTSHERTFILVFRHEEWLMRDNLLYLKCWAKFTPLEQKRRFSIQGRSQGWAKVVRAPRDKVITRRFWQWKGIKGSLTHSDPVLQCIVNALEVKCVSKKQFVDCQPRNCILC